MTDQPPFAAIPLADGRLRPLAADDGAHLGTACAAIDPFLRLGLSAAGLHRYLERPDPSLYRFVIEIEDLPAGVIALRWPWLRGPFLEMLAVLPIAQGRGIGRQAMDWAIDQSGRVAANLWTTVSDFNQPARRFYESAGFVEVAPLPGLVAPGGAEILMRKEL